MGCGVEAEKCASAVAADRKYGKIQSSSRIPTSVRRLMKGAAQALMAKLKERGEPELRPASVEDLKRAQAAGFPDELIDFYRQWEPERCVELKQRIWSIKEKSNIDARKVPLARIVPSLHQIPRPVRAALDATKGSVGVASLTRLIHRPGKLAGVGCFILPTSGAKLHSVNAPSSMSELRTAMRWGRTEPRPLCYRLAQRLLLRRGAHAEFFFSDKRALECMRSTTEPTNK